MCGKRLKFKFGQFDDTHACLHFCVLFLERVQIPDEEYLDVFVCNVHSTDNICVNLSGENYSVSLLISVRILVELNIMQRPSVEPPTPGGVEGGGGLCNSEIRCEYGHYSKHITRSSTNQDNDQRLITSTDDSQFT